MTRRLAHAFNFVVPHLTAIMLLAACATDSDVPGVKAPQASSTTGAGPQASPESENAASEKDIDSVIASVDDQADEGDEAVTDAPKGKVAPIATENNADVKKWLDYFSNRDHERFQRFLERGERYRPMIAAVLKDQGIPFELYYQAMIESGFASLARSRAQAVGIWQFMASTGRRYGLRIDGYVDERKDPMRATIAASLYLKDLYNVFQSWHLAIAAYNSGEGRIVGAIMQGKSRDFWHLADTGVLPNETADYVPKFLAAIQIGRDPARFGFKPPKSEPPPTLVSVAIPSPARLTDIAELVGMDTTELQEFNPHLLRGLTPPGAATYRIWVPKDIASEFEGQEAKLAGLRLKGVHVAAAEASGRPRVHKIAPGETLARIAADYGVSVRYLKRLNHLRSNRLTAGTSLLVGGQAESEAIAKLTKYRVRRGDTLDAIARRFGTTVQELKRLNRLPRDRVFAGQTLKVTVVGG